MVTIPTIKIVLAGGVVYSCFTMFYPHCSRYRKCYDCGSCGHVPWCCLHKKQLTAASALPENKASRSKVPAGNQKLVVPPALQLWSAVKVLENGYTLSTSMQTFGGIIHVSRIRVCSCLFILRSKLIFRNCPKGSKGTPFRQCVVFISFGSWWFWPKAFSWEILAWKRLREISPNLALSIGL
jgi:hypothetical protein